jgi:hypothetical protein
MKHIRPYKLFEQINNSDTRHFAITKSQFPDFRDFQELLFDLSDDNIISKANFISSGYFIYPKYEILHTYKREIRSAISYEMSVNPDDWQNKKCELIYDETYGSIFLRPDELNSKKIIEEEVDFNEVEEAIYLSKLNKLPHKPTLELFVDNIENGKIPAVPYININCGNFSIENKQIVIDSLIRIYKATGWRPYKEFWLEDYIEGELPFGNEVITYIGFNPFFVKVDDKTYKNLINSNKKVICSYPSIDITKEITSYLI